MHWRRELATCSSADSQIPQRPPYEVGVVASGLTRSSTSVRSFRLLVAILMINYVLEKYSRHVEFIGDEIKDVAQVG